MVIKNTNQLSSALCSVYCIKYRFFYLCSWSHLFSFKGSVLCNVHPERVVLKPSADQPTAWGRTSEFRNSAVNSQQNVKPIYPRSHHNCEYFTVGYISWILLYSQKMCTCACACEWNIWMILHTAFKWLHQLFAVILQASRPNITAKAFEIRMWNNWMLTNTDFTISYHTYGVRYVVQIYHKNFVINHTNFSVICKIT